MEINEYSQKVKLEAQDILGQTQLLDFLKEFGEVKIIGSYALDIMVARDIDIYVINKDFTKESVVDIYQQLIFKNDFKGYIFYDYVNRTKDIFPTGYYVGLKHRFFDKKWKVDIWFLNEPDKKSFDMMEKLENISEEKRELVLELKYYNHMNNLDVPSYIIYNGVLKNQLMSCYDLSALD